MSWFGDVEGGVRSWARANSLLTPLLGSGTTARVFFGVPTSYDPKTNGAALVLYRSGGAPRPGATPLDQPRLTFDCWGASKADAASLAVAVVEAIERVGQGTALGASLRAVSASVVMGPLWLPDPESGTPRYVVDASWTVRAAA